MVDENSVIEFVTYPNNPTGERREPVYSKTPFTVHDMAYYWPSLTNITHKADFDIMIFTESKSLGIAGTRLGHALVKDPKIAEYMAGYISGSCIHISNDALYRGISKMRYVTENSEYFDWVKEKMTYRW